MESSSPKILVVDDEPSVRTWCKLVLERNGFTSMLAVNGQEGLNLYSEQWADIDLVLSDIKMPVMDGVEMVRQIFKVTPHANIIVMTGFGFNDLMPDDVKKLCSSLSKPFQSQELLAEIRKCLKYEENRQLSS